VIRVRRIITPDPPFRWGVSEAKDGTNVHPMTSITNLRIVLLLCYAMRYIQSIVSSFLHLSPVLFIDQDISVPGLTSVHALDGLVDVIEAVLGGPSLDFVLCGKLEHLGDVFR